MGTRSQDRLNETERRRKFLAETIALVFGLTASWFVMECEQKNLKQSRPQLLTFLNMFSLERGFFCGDIEMDKRKQFIIGAINLGYSCIKAHEFYWTLNEKERKDYDVDFLLRLLKIEDPL